MANIYLIIIVFEKLSQIQQHYLYDCGYWVWLSCLLHCIWFLIMQSLHIHTPTHTDTIHGPTRRVPNRLHPQTDVPRTLTAPYHHTPHVHTKGTHHTATTLWQSRLLSGHSNRSIPKIGWTLPSAGGEEWTGVQHDSSHCTSGTLSHALIFTIISLLFCAFILHGNRSLFLCNNYYCYKL